MRLPCPRFSVRRIMVAVAIVAVATAGFIEAGKRVRLARARRDYERVGAYYEEGRVTLDRYVAASRRLMDARIAASLTRKGQAAAIKAHVERVIQMAQEERKWLELACVRGGTAVAIAEVEHLVDECKAMERRMLGGR